MRRLVGLLELYYVLSTLLGRYVQAKVLNWGR